MFFFMFWFFVFSTGFSPSFSDSSRGSFAVGSFKFSQHGNFFFSSFSTMGLPFPGLFLLSFLAIVLDFILSQLSCFCAFFPPKHNSPFFIWLILHRSITSTLSISSFFHCFPYSVWKCLFVHGFIHPIFSGGRSRPLRRSFGAKNCVPPESCLIFLTHPGKFPPVFLHRCHSFCNLSILCSSISHLCT